MTDQMSPDLVILTGAGFSNAFGLPLATEFNTYLSNDPNVRENALLLQLLKSLNNFEAIYSILQENGVNENFKRFDDALRKRFEIMNEHSLKAKKQGYMVFSFLKIIEDYFYDRGNNSHLHFFTLNQDILLENLLQLREGSRGGVDLIYPGICYICGHDESDYKYDRQCEGIELYNINNISSIQINQALDFKKLINCQKDAQAIDNANQYVPNVHKILYYKIHGSSNWFDSGNKTMILGTNKDTKIKKNSLLAKYFNEFESEITGKNLFVIGYSFNDEHVNRIIRRAVENFGTKVYYLSPDANFSNKELIYKADFIYNMFPYRFQDIINYDCRQDGRMPFEMREVRRALGFRNIG